MVELALQGSQYQQSEDSELRKHKSLSLIRCWVFTLGCQSLWKMTLGVEMFHST